MMRLVSRTLWLAGLWVALALPTMAQPVKMTQPWLPQGRLASAISVTNVTGATQLPNTSGSLLGAVAWVCNTGANDALLAFGGSSITVTATAGTKLAAGTCWGYDLRPFPAPSTVVYTYIAAITAASTTSLSVETGTGTPPFGASLVTATQQTIQSGVGTNLISCDSHVFRHITSATDTLAVQGVAAKTIYVCGALGQGAGTAWFLENTASANANCSSSNTQISGTGTTATASAGGFYSALWGGLKNTAGNGLCINSTGTGGVDVDIWYTQF